MKRSFITHTAIIAIAIILLGISVLARSQASKAGQEKTLTGVVSDNMCGAQHMLKDSGVIWGTRLAL